MSNILYDSARNAFLTGNINWKDDSIYIGMVKSTYAVSQGSHTVTGDIGSNFSSYSQIQLANKSASAGVADADDVTFIAGSSNESITGAIIWKTGSTPATCYLIAYIDTATGFPLTTNGANIDLAFDNGANKIFKL